MESYLGDESAPSGEIATGDIGRLDEAGYLYISGRKKNVLITSYGRNVSPEWVEAEHPLLKRRAAVKVLHRAAGMDSDALLRFVSEAQAANQIRNDSQVAAITRSSKGSVILSGSESWIAPVTAAPVVDATGAGDQYAAGVLYGVTHGLSLQEAARLGNFCAGEVISHIGPQPHSSDGRLQVV